MKSQLVVIVAGLACLLGHASSASARYRDGMSLYAYVADGPTKAPDPTGTKIFAPAGAQGQVADAIVRVLPGLGGNVAQEWVGGEKDPTQRNGCMFGAKQDFRIRNNLRQEILSRLLESRVVYEPSAGGLMVHIQAREAIVNRAMNSKFFLGTDTVRFEPEKDETTNAYVQRVVKDLWDTGKTSGCARAAASILYAGMADAAAAEAGPPKNDASYKNMEPNVGFVELANKGIVWEDWVPGDAGYIANMARAPGATRPASMAASRPADESGFTAGENIIYLGNDKFYGLLWAAAEKKESNLPGGGGGMSLTSKEWDARVDKWGRHGHANVRWVPRIGLSVDPLIDARYDKIPANSYVPKVGEGIVDYADWMKAPKPPPSIKF